MGQAQVARHCTQKREQGMHYNLADRRRRDSSQTFGEALRWGRSRGPSNRAVGIAMVGRGHHRLNINLSKRVNGGRA